MSTHLTAEEHAHNWTTASRHNTSEGIISYQHCTCGAQRILASQDRAMRGLLAVVPAR